MTAPAAAPRAGLVLALGSAQTLAFASSYYLPAILAAPMAGDLGVATSTVFAAFSISLAVSALLGPAAGRALDRFGGRAVLIASSCIFAAGLGALALVQEPWVLFAAWALIGVGMVTGLYESAFSALVRLHGAGSRNAITGVTLIAGFASTVGWPISALLEGAVGWRGACLAWAAAHLLIGLPLHLMLPRDSGDRVAATRAVSGSTAPEPAGTRRAMILLALVFSIAWFIATAMAAHLPRLVQASGASLAVAVAVGALIGPAQVAGRLIEFGLLRRLHPLTSTRLAAISHPVGALLLVAFGAPVAAVFAVLHGFGNGIMTIAKGTLPLAFFGPDGYGLRQGKLMVPTRFAQAAAPWLFGVCLDRWQAGALWLSIGLGCIAFGALFALPRFATR